MKIAVLMGGDSSEREISLLSGKAIVAALDEIGHEVVAVELQNVRDVLHDSRLTAAEVVFPALHGGWGEDGHLQAVLDVLGIPCALSGPLACALAMDKAVTKRIMRGADIPTPDWLQITWDSSAHGTGAVVGRDDGLPGRALTLDHVKERAEDEIGFPLVIKLNTGGSSVGLRIVDGPGDFHSAFTEVAAAEAGPVADILIERYIPGRELTAAIFLGRRLPLVEIRPRDGFYDYQHKYTSGASEYLVPAPVHSPLYEDIARDALRIFELLCCKGLARVDFRLDGDAYSCLEINTIPGMTGTSLVPMAAEAVGIGFGELLEDLCRAALADGSERN